MDIQEKLSLSCFIEGKVQKESGKKEPVLFLFTEDNLLLPKKLMTMMKRYLMVAMGRIVWLNI
jgi:hypothetical protein